MNYKKYNDIINPFNFKRGKTKYHLDHIYSVQDGFENNIPEEIIASPVNLRMLKAKKNLEKWYNSEFTKEELYNLYEQFKEEKEEWKK